MKTEEFFYNTRDNFQIYVKRYFPENETQIKGVIQFVHGMLEYSGRYENLAEFFVSQGFAFCCYDQRGHGKTAELSEKNDTGMFGKIADKNGFSIAVEDIREMSEINRNRFPKKKLFILSYSFGSFCTQRFMQNFGNTVDGCILCGTNGPNNLVNFLSALFAEFLCLFGRDRKIAFVEEFVSNIYIRQIGGKHSCNLDWMCTLKEDIETYLADPWCYFRETIGFHTDMMWGNLINHRKKNIRKVPLSLPVLFIYGKADPVGGYGKFIKKISDTLISSGHSDVTMKGYERGGHDILTEYCAFQVWNDISGWSSNHL